MTTQQSDVLQNHVQNLQTEGQRGRQAKWVSQEDLVGAASPQPAAPGQPPNSVEPLVPQGMDWCAGCGTTRVTYRVFLGRQERQLHFLIGTRVEVAVRRTAAAGSLVFASTRAHQEEEAGHHQGDGDSRDQDEQDLLPGALRRL